MDKENLKELVGCGDLDQAFAALLGYGKSRKAIVWYNALLIQYNQFRSLEQDKLKGILSTEEENLSRNRILSALLSLIDDLPDGQESSTPAEPLTPQVGKTRRYLWSLFSIVVLVGLIVGYSKLDLFTPQKNIGLPPTETTMQQENSSLTRALYFPDGHTVTFIFSTGMEISYHLLQGELKNLGGDVRLVSLTIRCSAQKGNGANFWDDTFRLELEEPGALLAPSSGLNEVVENNSFKDGTVSFEVKEPISNMNLAIVNPWNKEDIRKLAISLE